MNHILKIESFKIGMSKSFIRIISSDDVLKFAEVTGDDNPLHIDDDFAQKTIFKKRVVHGMLVTSLFSKIFGTQFPGHGCIYLEQNVKFKKPIYLDDEIEVFVVIKSIDVDKCRLNFDTHCKVKDEIVLIGNAVILIPKV
jgi:3-hydroxybutyryl-CoA dehydratase